MKKTEKMIYTNTFIQNTPNILIPHEPDSNPIGRERLLVMRKIPFHLPGHPRFIHKAYYPTSLFISSFSTPRASFSKVHYLVFLLVYQVIFLFIIQKHNHFMYLLWVFPIKKFNKHQEQKEKNINMVN